jgi:hypothetical protein
MNAQLKSLYLTQTRQGNYPYAAWATPLTRLWAIFRTSNLTRFPDRQIFSPPSGAAGMAPIWAILSPISANPALIPTTRPAFDVWAEPIIQNIATTYSGHAPYPLGIAQKTFNLFLKDHWAWTQLTREQEDCLHVPIDGIIYKKFSTPPQTWETWTSVQWNIPLQFTNLWHDYMALQNALRARAILLSSPTFVMSPIMLEQILWGGI